MPALMSDVVRIASHGRVGGNPPGNAVYADSTVARECQMPRRPSSHVTSSRGSPHGDIKHHLRTRACRSGGAPGSSGPVSGTVRKVEMVDEGMVYNSVFREREVVFQLCSSSIPLPDYRIATMSSEPLEILMCGTGEVSPPRIPQPLRIAHPPASSTQPAGPALAVRSRTRRSVSSVSPCLICVEGARSAS